MTAQMPQEATGGDLSHSQPWSGTRTRPNQNGTVNSDLLTFARQLRAAYCREVSELPELWTPENPSTGCCHVSAICLQWRLGGWIIQGTYDGVPHFWNEIDGITIDITRDQFELQGTLWTERVAPAPLQVTLDKAALLAELAWKAAA